MAQTNKTRKKRKRRPVVTGSGATSESSWVLAQRLRHETDYVTPLGARFEGPVIGERMAGQPGAQRRLLTLNQSMSDALLQWRIQAAQHQDRLREAQRRAERGELRYDPVTGRFY